MLDDLMKEYRAAKKRYDAYNPAIEGCLDVATTCLKLLCDNSDLRYFGDFSKVDPIQYHVAEGNNRLSRPFRPELFIADVDDFSEQASEFAKRLAPDEDYDADLFDRVVYTAVSSFSLCIDLWRHKSRKTPGTFFEVFIGSAAIAAFPNYESSKHVPIVDEDLGDDVDAMTETDEVDGDATEFSGNSVSTDLVITNPANNRGAVIPLKITTRERIVQPFAHQRILDSAYPGKFASFISCISETQRDDNGTTVKQVCVPGTVALFQKHLASVNGLYYCDVPRRYAQDDLAQIIAVKPFSQLFIDVAAHLADD